MPEQEEVKYQRDIDTILEMLSKQDFVDYSYKLFPALSYLDRIGIIKKYLLIDKNAINADYTYVAYDYDRIIPAISKHREI